MVETGLQKTLTLLLPYFFSFQSVDSNVISVFMDDNAEESILDLRDSTCGHAVHMDEAIRATHVVTVEPARVILDDEYFVERLKVVLQAKDQVQVGRA